MINSTRCAILAKQACATFSQVVQKITPPIANNFLKFFFALFATLTLNAATAWGATYTKVTSAPSDWSGEYLIVYESGMVAFDGSLTTLDAASNTQTVTIANNTITLDSKYSFTISKSGANYTIKSASGMYIGNNSNSNALSSSTSSLNNTISFSSANDITIKSSGGAYLRYNSASNQLRFRYYKSSSYTGQKAICLYKKVDVPQTVAVTGVSLNKTSLTLTEGDSETLTATVAPANATDKTVTWSTSNANFATVSNGKVTAVAEGSATITVKTKDGNKTATCNVTVNPKPKYTVTLVPCSGSVSSTTLIEASAGAGVSLPTPTLDCGDWKFAGWAEESVNAETTTKPTLIPAGAYNPASNITLYAVYQRTETTNGGGNSVSESITIEPNTFPDKGTSSYASGAERTGAVNEISLGGHYITGNQNNTPTGSIAGTYLQCQAKNATIYNKTKLPGNITKVVINQYDAKAFSLYCGSEQLMASNNTSTEQTPSGTKINDVTAATKMTWDVSGDYTYFALKKGSNTGYVTSIVVTYTTSGSGSTIYYHSTPECAAPCTDFVTISQGTLSNGSFKLDKTGEQSTCNGAVTVTLSDIQPVDGYQFSTITQSGVDDAKVTIDNVAKTVTYAQNTTGESTINVTFTPIEYTLELESTLSCVTNGSATIAYNATSAKTFTAATRDDYTCTGYWNAPSGGVQVLKADGTFVGDVSGFISGGKWVNTTATKLTPRWETEYKMILSKGTEENGTYTLSPTNIETSSCATSTTRQVTITATPVVGYEVDQITYSGEGTATIKTGPTISAGKTTWVYTFDENDKGLGTFIVTFKQLPTYTVTWMANEQQHAAQTAAVGTSLTNPGDPEASTYACDDKVFVGWTAEKNYSHTTTAPDDLFKSAEATSKTIPENGITYCAVFANATTIPGVTTTTEETATLSFADEAQRESISSTQQVWKQNGIVFTNNQAGSSTPVADYVNPVRCYKGSNIILDCSELGNIANVLFKCTSSDYASDLASSIGSEASPSTTWVTLIPKTETKVYEISLSSGQTRISSLIVTYEKSIVNDPIVTYSNYSTTCEAIPDVELQSIEISGDLTKKNYTAGDDLDFGGLTVTAKYSNAPSKNVTNEVKWSDVTLTVGQTSVTLTATYEGKTDDITITGLTVSSPATPEPESEWVLTTLADITCSDLVVITMKNSNGTYALTNGNGTSDAPKATKVEIANDKLKTEPSEILQWVVMNNNGDLTIYPVNDYNRWLYCFKHNNGVRVGDNQNNVFTIDDETGYLYHVYEKRYLGVYNSSDWRCYETVNNNIKDQTLAFFVKKDANPNPCEKPVDDGINPVATFIFNTAEGLDDLGIDYPNTSAGSGAYKNDMSNDESYTQEGITFTNVQNGPTATRVWRSSAGNLDLRIYQNATVKFSVPDNMYIRKIIFNGDALSSISPDKGNLKSKIWSGREREVLFSVADGADVVKIYTISFALEYTRNVTPYEYGTICLPYGSSDYTGAEFYEVSSVEYGKGLWLDQLAAGTALAAGKPYIFRATAEKLAVVYKGEKKDSPIDGVNGLTGTFTDIAANSTLVGHYIIALNQIWVANDKNTLPAYRAYINAEDVPTTAQAQLPGRRRVCMGENAATGLDNITNGENNTIKVIENGQLFIIRNGEKYNIQGQKL